MQYRRMNHDTFDKLVAALLIDEKYGLLLQGNHDERRLSRNPPGLPQGTPEANFGGTGRNRLDAEWQERLETEWL